MTTIARNVPDFDVLGADFAALFPDIGCDLAPLCKECPFLRCRYDEPGGIPAIVRAERDEDVVARVQHGETVQEIAEAVSLSPRRVWGIIQKGR